MIHLQSAVTVWRRFASGRGEGMRKLMWFAIGFSCASAICAYLLSGVWMFFLSLFCIVFVVLSVCCFRKKIHPIVIVLFFGLFTGAFYQWSYDWIVLSSARNYDGKVIPVEITATDYSFSTDYGNGVDGKLHLNGKAFRTRLYYQTDAMIVPGDSIRILAKLRYTPYGGLEVSTYHKGEGIFLLAYGQNEPVVKKRTQFGVRYIPSYVRKEICDRIMEIFPEDTAGFSKALLIGEDSDVSFSQNISFQKSGIRHIIAVSGLHVSIMFSVIYLVTFRRRLLTLLVSLPVMFLFAAVSGFSPSIIRACVMQVLIMVSDVILSEYDRETALATAAVVILLINPYAITSVNFQLSIGCMVGIFAFSGPIREFCYKKLNFSGRRSFKSKMIRWFGNSISVSLSATIITLPLCAMYFDMVTVAGVITNLLVLWIIPFAFCGIIAACLLSYVWLPLGAMAAWGVSWGIRYVTSVSWLLSRIPGACAYTDSPYTVLWIVCVAIFILYIIIKRKHSTLVITGIAALYVASLLASWIQPRVGNVQVTILDVGQGQCVLLQSKNEVYMVDCGGSDPKQTATAAINAMGAQGIVQLDGLILTHYDTDHCNGAPYLLEVVPVKQLYLPDTDPENEMRQKLEKMETNITWVSGNVLLDLKKGNLEIFSKYSGETSNESSLCILFRSDKCDILITGDRSISGEQYLLEHENIPELELLVAGHHGASASTGLELLRQCSPAVVAISVGEDNPHGHPNDDTLKRLQSAGCVIRRTDLEGTIIFRG